MHYVIGEAGSQSEDRMVSEKVGLSFQSKVQLAVRTMCLSTYAYSILATTKILIPCAYSKVRQDCH